MTTLVIDNPRVETTVEQVTRISRSLPPSYLAEHGMVVNVRGRRPMTAESARMVMAHLADDLTRTDDVLVPVLLKTFTDLVSAIRAAERPSATQTDGETA